MSETTPGLVYRETGILLHAHDAEGAASHCPRAVVDDDVVWILSHQVPGYPKKMGEITLKERSARVAGSA